MNPFYACRYVGTVHPFAWFISLDDARDFCRQQGGLEIVRLSSGEVVR